MVCESHSECLRRKRDKSHACKDSTEKEVKRQEMRDFQDQDYKRKEILFLDRKPTNL